nr:hypothetical protein CFP56_64005 [Quercus suber]
MHRCPLMVKPVSQLPGTVLEKIIVTKHRLNKAASLVYIFAFVDEPFQQKPQYYVESSESLRLREYASKRQSPLNYKIPTGDGVDRSIWSPSHIEHHRGVVNAEPSGSSSKTLLGTSQALEFPK